MSTIGGEQVGDGPSAWGARSAMQTVLVLLIVFLILAPSETLAQDPCIPSRFAEEIAAPSVFDPMEAPPRPPELNDNVWNLLQETSNTYGSSDPARIARLARSERIFASVIANWNGEFSVPDAHRAIQAEVDANGVRIGLLYPMLMMLEVSYAAYPHEDTALIAPLLNPAIAEINPRLANLFCRELGLPMELRGPEDQSQLDLGDWVGIEALISERMAPLGSASIENVEPITGLSGLDAMMRGGGRPAPRSPPDSEPYRYEFPDLNDDHSSEELRRACQPGCNLKSVMLAIDLAPLAAETGPVGLTLATAVIILDNVNCRMDCDEKVRERAEEERLRWQQRTGEKIDTTGECNPDEDPECRRIGEDVAGPAEPEEEQPVAMGAPRPGSAASDSSVACLADPDGIECSCQKQPDICPVEPIDPNDTRCSLEKPPLGCAMSQGQIEAFLRCASGKGCGPISSAPVVEGRAIDLVPKANPDDLVPGDKPTATLEVEAGDGSFQLVAKSILDFEGELELSPDAEAALRMQLAIDANLEGLSDNEMRSLWGIAGCPNMSSC